MPQEVAVTWPCSRPSPFVAWVMLEGVGSGMMRKLTSLFLVLLIPSAMVAAEGDTAVLYGTGAVYLNGAQLGTSSAVTNGDVIQTKDTGAANLTAAGSSVVIQWNS